MSSLTHFDATGQAHMVDVGEKAETRRRATATGHITMQPETFALLDQWQAKKGDVLGVARLAAIQGTKHTALLIPLCHPLALTHVGVEFEKEAALHRVHIRVTTETVGRTGVEMEALSGAMAGLLDAYQAVRPLEAAERELLPAMLRAAALRFWVSRLWDFYLPREASLLKPHDPTHFERVLRERLATPYQLR